jgi:hypothetical protein
MSKKQTRVTCWLDEDILIAFNTIHPVHGATTKFIRSCFSQYIRKNKEKVKTLFHELDLEDPNNEFN